MIQVSLLLVLKGQIESALEQDSLAIKSFCKAAVLNPKNMSAFFFEGLSYSLLNLDDSAITCYDRAIALKKSEGQIYFEEFNNEHLPLEDQTDIPILKVRYFRGLSHFYLNDYNKAVDDFLYSIASSYEVTKSQYYLGVSYLKKEKQN
jgi:tetratricopeptide (TPR) repeat protein